MVDFRNRSDHAEIGMVVAGLDAVQTLTLGAGLGGLAVGLALGWLLTRVSAVARLRERLARVSAEVEAVRRGEEEKLALVERMEDRLRDAFGSLSAEALQFNNRTFLELARGSLGEQQRVAAADLEHRQNAIEQLVRPLRDAIVEVDKNLHSAETDRSGAYEKLAAQVSSLGQSQERLQAETINLSKALRTPTVRGRWGELQLRRVVELAGMSEHCDFSEQETLFGDNGRGRPDVLIQLPGGRVIAVDAKVPLTSYLEAAEATDEADADAKLARHGREVRAHVTALGAREYWEKLQPAPELVVMFLPGEAIFSAALRVDPELIEFASERRVVLASPTTLISLLRAVAHGWREERLAQNAQTISRLGRELYDRARVLAEHFEGIRRGLESASEGYNRAVAALESRVLVTVRRLRDLGAGGAEEIAEVRPLDTALRRPQANGDNTPRSVAR